MKSSLVRDTIISSVVLKGIVPLVKLCPLQEINKDSTFTSMSVCIWPGVGLLG